MAPKSLLDSIYDQVGTSQQYPIHQWNPPLSGDIDIVIEADGTWLHEGSGFARKEIVQLFASLLKCEEGEYYLVTPVEKWRITVIDLPFVVTQLEVEINNDNSENESVLKFTTNMGESIVANAEHPVIVDYIPGQEEPRPKLLVRDNLYGRIHRNVFYALVEQAQQIEEHGKTMLAVNSGEHRFVLGSL